MVPQGWPLNTEVLLLHQSHSGSFNYMIPYLGKGYLRTGKFGENRGIPDYRHMDGLKFSMPTINQSIWLYSTIYACGTTSSFFLGTIIHHFLVFSMNLYWQEQICLVCWANEYTSYTIGSIDQTWHGLLLAQWSPNRQNRSVLSNRCS